MEFPDLGANCAKSDCRKLDFLPIKCQQCQKLFCEDHFYFESHGCPNTNDFQISACPLCGVPIPCERNQPPDIFVERHILSNCTSHQTNSLKGKTFSNKCAYAKCTTRETVKISCATCHKSFCIRHRLEIDHDCGKVAQETPIFRHEPPQKCGLSDRCIQFDDASHNALTADPVLSNNATVSKDKSKEKEMYQMVNPEDRKMWLIKAKRRSCWRKGHQVVNDSFRKVRNSNDKESILKLCGLEEIKKFEDIFPIEKITEISKLCDGSSGEIFSVIDTENMTSVVKIIPMEGSVEYNGGPQTTYNDIISEIVLARELSGMKIGTRNRCRNYVQLNNVSLVSGRFPNYFQREWYDSNDLKSSANDNPTIFQRAQKWIILQFEYSGCPLENFELQSWEQAYSILLQTCLALACAENDLEFEHRNLHWGNLLVLKSDTNEEQDDFFINGNQYSIHNHGVRLTIIDFTFSRIKKGDKLVYTDMSIDKDIFLGTGDIQFDVYRQMKTYNKDNWDRFNPKTNIFWLTYLGNKLLDAIKSRPEIPDNEFKTKFENLVPKIKDHRSANNLVNFIWRSMKDLVMKVSL